MNSIYISRVSKEMHHLVNLFDYYVLIALSTAIVQLNALITKILDLSKGIFALSKLNLVRSPITTLLQ
jgi:hypothetical protein